VALASIAKARTFNTSNKKRGARPATPREDRAGLAATADELPMSPERLFFPGAKDPYQLRPHTPERFLVEQLRIARDFDLPVILHVRRAQDAVLKQLRRLRPRCGIAHAFNGSEQQARKFVELGCALGFGGAMSFDRARQIRRLAAAMPLEACVLETDAPDIAPAWLAPGRNVPAELPAIAAVFARLRGEPLERVLEATGANARRVLPRLEATRGSPTP
jgi:Tat protein secretion system quality control protein TatD with DNase activity